MEDAAQVHRSTASADEEVRNEGSVEADTEAASVAEPSHSTAKPLRILMDNGPDRNAAEAFVAWMPFSLSIKKVLRLFGALAVSAFAVTWLISARSTISMPEIDESREHPRSEEGVGAVSTDEDVDQDLDATGPVTLQSNETALQPRTESPVAESTTSPAPVILDKRIIERDFQGSMTVQIASLLSRESADRVLAEAEALTGLQGVVYPPLGQESQWYVIYLGSFTSVEMAEAAAQPLFVEQLITEVLVKPVPRGYEPQLAGELD
jgi:septal ring-binding cell division protein DamX